VSWFSVIIPGFHHVIQNVKHCKFHMNMHELAVSEVTHDVSLAYGSSLVAYDGCSPSKIDTVAAL
jgi:hypothetical protein